MKRIGITGVGIAVVCGWGAASALAATGLLNTPPGTVTTFRVFELHLGAATPGTNPYLNGPSVTATFTGTSGPATGQVLVMKGFWDGTNVWKIRFAATATGDWSYATTSTDSGLNGVAGSVTAVAPTGAELNANALYHGFLQRDGYSWKLSDGTLFLPVGDTQWSFSEEFYNTEWELWMNARQAQHYNTFWGCIWLAIYPRAATAFTSQNPQTDVLQVSFMQKLDQMVQYANDRGIMMGLTIGGFPGNSTWFGKMATLARNDRWFKYCVARYAAYNVRWGLYGEVNEANPPGGWGGGITTWQQQVAHDAQLVKDEDPYDHPLGSHNTGVDTSSAANPNIDYIEVQIDTCGGRTETQYVSALNYRSYGKPVWFEEYWYETCDTNSLGIRNTHRNFVAAMAFPTMASLMRYHFNSSPQPNASQAGSDPYAIRTGYFATFFQNLDFAHFSPASSKINSPGQARQCGKFGNSYAIFLQGGGSVTLDLTSDSGAFAVTKLDINTGVTASLGTVLGTAPRTIVSGTTSDVSILVTYTGPVNQAPSVNAGIDQVVKPPALASLNGTVTDDGLPNPPATVTTTWSKVSGPGTVTFGDASAVDTTAAFSRYGVYVLRLTANDSALSTSDDVTVTASSYGDMEPDGDVDLTDLGLLQLCYAGPTFTVSSGCLSADSDGDNDVDLIDFALFQSCFNGPSRPPACE